MMLFAVFFGLCWGSFLNVLIDRLPNGENVLWGRSHCDYCKRNLRWYELLPVVSFLLQKGRCLRCKRKLSWQYPLIEIVTAIGFAAIASAFGYSSPVIIGAACIIYSSFLVLFVTDMKYQIIPDSMVVIGMLGSFLWVWFSIPHHELVVRAITSVSSFFFFLSLWFVTHKKGIGLGDVKLSFVLGLLLGYPEIIMALYVAFLTGAAVGVILIVVGNKTLKSKIAFGPFLLLGTAVVIVFNSSCLHIWNAIF